jgi:serine protease Do
MSEEYNETIYTSPYVQPQQPQKKEKKPSAFGRFVKKGCTLIASAAVFGLIAGGVFYGVNYAADKQLGTNVVTPAQTTFEIATAASSNNSNNSMAEKTSSTNLSGMDVSDLVQDSMPAMVSVTGTVTTSYGFNPFFGGGTTETPTAGSGVIIGQNDKELLIVTNAHVVDDVNNLSVTFVDGTSASATVKGSKSNKDIAVIAVSLSDLSEETAGNISIIEIGDSDELQVGQPIIAIGNALGEGQSVTVGWVSALNNTITIDSTTYEGLIRISAAINPGNSGGALLNPQGQLIGINSAKYSDESVEGIGYAIPISSVADIINNLMNREIREKVEDGKSGVLGISGINITSDINKMYGWPMGVAVAQVEEGSGAEAAGLKKNDIIVGFDGVDISTLDELKDLLTYYSAGETVKIEYYRIADGEYVLNTTDITLGSRN